MLKKLAGSVAVLAFSAVLMLPLSASATMPPYTPTNNGLTQAQIAAVISLLQSFGADASVVANVRAALGGTVTPPSSCLDISRNLTLGSQGSDVMSLQQYLIAKGYLDAQYTTGYYGFLTAQAVGRLQVALGIVSSANDPAYGVFGPRTRAAIGCGVTPPPPGTMTFSASPTSGRAPLTVSFNGSGLTSSGLHVIEFGDGTNSGALGTNCQVPPGPVVNCSVAASHVYQNPGTYTATLQPYVACMWSDPRCLMAIDIRSIRTVTITVQ